MVPPERKATPFLLLSIEKALRIQAERAFAVKQESPEGTVTVLLTHVVSSTELTNHLGDATARYPAGNDRRGSRTR